MEFAFHIQYFSFCFHNELDGGCIGPTIVSNVFDVWQVVPAWLSCLPIKGDLIEAKVVHEQLCAMVER
jgi:hypothetical protein